VWNVKTGERLGKLLEHDGWVQSVALSRDGNLIVSGSGDTKIRMWCTKDYTELSRLPNNHTDDILSVALSPDGKYVVSGSADNTIRVWDTENRKAFRDPLLGHADYVRSVVISQDGQHVVSGSDDTTVSLWNLEFPDHQVSEGPTKALPSNLTHPAFATSSFQGFNTQTSLTKDGWLVGPKGQLLLFIPPNFYPSIVHKVVVISSSTSQLDLRRVEHGPSWSKCRG
jgi:WD40 repeat protein